MATVRDNLNRIESGLWTPDLQIVDSNPNRGGNASGYVRCSYSEMFRTADADRERSTGGRIHIRFATYGATNTVANQQNCGITIVHEAAHKFCGSRDWQYNAEGVAGYFATIATLGMWRPPCRRWRTTKRSITPIATRRSWQMFD